MINIKSGKNEKYPQTIRENRGSDKLVFRSFREKLVIGSLVKQHHVVHLLLLLSLAPLLLIQQRKKKQKPTSYLTLKSRKPTPLKT